MIVDCFGSSVIGRRQTNQDSIACHLSADGRAALIAVADGMGGYQGGDIASRLAIDAVEGAPLALIQSGSTTATELDSALLAAAEQANHAICRRRGEEPRHAKMGTTLTAALLWRGHLSLIHIGDSRCYRFRQGALEQVTEDHNLAQQLVAEKALAVGDLASHPYSNILTRALGVEAEARVCARQINVEAGDAFLICSDGVTGVLEDKDIAAVLGQGLAPRPAAEMLLRQCVDRDTSDNASLVIATVSD